MKIEIWSEPHHRFWLNIMTSSLVILMELEMNSPLVPQTKRTNLKKPNSERTGHSLRVKFNPLALLLDASLEGEFDLVQRIIYEVNLELRLGLSVLIGKIKVHAISPWCAPLL